MSESATSKPEQVGQSMSGYQIPWSFGTARAVIMAVVAAAAVAWVVVDASSLSARLTITGHLTLWVEAGYTVDMAPGDWPILVTTAPDGAITCAGNAGYADISAGAPVTVHGDGFTVVGAELGKGSAARIGANNCRFPFSVPELPTRNGVYSIEVSDRGRTTISDEPDENGVMLVELVVD